MYPRPRTAGYRKTDPVKRWALPDRVLLAALATFSLTPFLSDMARQQ
jgi:hypothetical protein